MGGMSVGSASITLSNTEALPDSGTTLIEGPSSQIYDLFDTICSQWTHCTGINNIVNDVKQHCSDDLPDITLQFGGTSVSISASSYIMEYEGECFPAFDYYDDPTMNLWIVGLPVFLRPRNLVRRNQQQNRFQRRLFHMQEQQHGARTT